MRLEAPRRATHELPPTLFPTQHLLELLAKAEAGENFYETTLFDGSEDADKVLTTTLVIGKPAPPAAGAPEKAAMDAIGDDPFWPVDIAYFDGQGAGGEELPVYRISFKLHRNGVTRDLVMDYGEFSMTGQLVDLALFDPPSADCDEGR